MEPRLPPPASKEEFKDQRSGLTLVSRPGKNCQVNHEVYLFCKLDRRETHGIKEIYELHII